MSLPSSGRALRRARTNAATRRQARLLGRLVRVLPGYPSPHVFAKHHALSCSRPHCRSCGNPRRMRGRRNVTLQERRADERTRQELFALA